MITRILGEGRFDVTAQDLAGIDDLYRQVADAAVAGDAEQYELLLPTLLTEVRARGRPIGLDHLGTFDLLLPSKDASIDDTKTLLGITALLRAGIVPG
jgi:hypothetical protein